MRQLVLTGKGLIFALMALAMAACGGGFESGPLGAVEVKAGEPIEIRSVLSHTGAPSLGAHLHAAIEIAIKDFGPIEGRQVSVESIDEMCLPEGGRAAGEAVVANPQVVGVIGTSCSAAAVEMSPIISEAGLVMISPSNTSPVLTSDLKGNANSDYHKGYYRISDNDVIEAGLVADFSYNELGLRRVVTIHDGDAYTTALANAFAAAFSELGGAVPVIAEVDKGQADMAAVLAQMEEADPDGMFIPLFPTEATTLTQQAAQIKGLNSVKKIGGSALLAADFLALPETQGFYYSGPDLGNSANVNQATGRSAAEILAEFESANGPPTSPYWGHAYDAATLLLSAIKQVAVVDGDSVYIDRMALRDELDGAADFQGIVGKMTCDAFGDCGTGMDDAIRSPSVEPGPLGSVEVKPGQPIEIRALLSDSAVPSVSPLIQTAIDIAIKDFGPINGRQVSIETLDEMCSGEGGSAAAEAVVAEAQVVGVIGTLCSGAAVEASPIISEAGLSMVSPANTSPLLTSDLAGNVSPNYHEGYYRVTDNDLIEANIVASYSYEELGLRTMATVHDGDAYTTALANAFAAAFSELGGTDTVIAKVDKGQTDMTAVLDQLDAAGPDGMFLPLFPSEAGALIQQGAHSGGLEDVTIIAGSAALVTNVLALPESEGVYFTSPDLGESTNTNQATGKSAADLLAEFETVLGGPPTSSYWAHGYDAATLLLSAIQQVAIVDGDTLHIDRAALRDALSGTADFEGIIGTISCDDYGDCGTGRSLMHLHSDSSITDPLLVPIVYNGEP